LGGFAEGAGSDTIGLVEGEGALAASGAAVVGAADVAGAEQSDEGLVPAGVERGGSAAARAGQGRSLIAVFLTRRPSESISAAALWTRSRRANSLAPKGVSRLAAIC